MTFTPVFNPPEKKVKKIVLEEHFNTPDLAIYAKDLGKSIRPDVMQYMEERLLDFDNLRLEEMDNYGIDISVLSVTTPGVQVEPDRNVAVRKAKDANDILAKAIQRHPTRYAGFAHLALQDPLEAAITTTGVNFYPSLLCSMLALGSDRIMFSVDYPYESTKEAVEFIDSAPLSDIDRQKICHLNAERILHMGEEL